MKRKKKDQPALTLQEVWALAKEGAPYEIARLKARIALLQREFRLPADTATGTPVSVSLEPEAEPVPARRTMTAAQKKAVSARMKKYWAARRKAEAK